MEHLFFFFFFNLSLYFIWFKYMFILIFPGSLTSRQRKKKSKAGLVLLLCTYNKSQRCAYCGTLCGQKTKVEKNIWGPMVSFNSLLPMTKQFLSKNIFQILGIKILLWGQVFWRWGTMECDIWYNNWILLYQKHKRILL